MICCGPCVCVRERAGERAREKDAADDVFERAREKDAADDHVFECVCVYVRVCMCVCLYVCVCVCVFVCEREGGGDDNLSCFVCVREREKGEAREEEQGAA